MLQEPATKPLLQVMPGYSRLFRRRATYYFRVGVPQKLRNGIGKTEIIKSLRMTDFAEAKRLVAIESTHADALFNLRVAKIETGCKNPNQSRLTF